MATTVTKRVSGAITKNITKRTPFDGGDASIYDAWGSSWGTPSRWGSSWLVFLSLTQIGHTARVSGTASAGITKRVTGV